MFEYTEIWACMLCLCFKCFPPEKVEPGLSRVWQVAGVVVGQRCLGFWWADILLIRAYQVFLRKTPVAFVQPSLPWWRGELCLLLGLWKNKGQLSAATINCFWICFWVCFCKNICALYAPFMQLWFHGWQRLCGCESRHGCEAGRWCSCEPALQEYLWTISQMMTNRCRFYYDTDLYLLLNILCLFVIRFELPVHSYFFHHVLLQHLSSAMKSWQDIVLFVKLNVYTTTYTTTYITVLWHLCNKQNSCLQF